ncbi:MAG: 4-aminobutyrate aminotransferase/(S)-3-amino-2-methylpropionate transaminase [Bradymonadia bacterium]|jgi:4-aminobutyrate aminotransferase/(S)-3-amino-2-methylpropionate transaminase
MDGTQLPKLVSPPPGPLAREWVARLAEVECPAITARRVERSRDGVDDPIVWASARGANVVDVDGNRYVDLSAGFAVASIGHAHPKVVEAGQRQLETLIHGMGDLFPSTPKILLGERLAALTPGDLQHSILGANGSDAVEACIKTAQIATGKRRVLSFAGSYHGMSLGALRVSGYRDSFRTPFDVPSELRLPYPGSGVCRGACRAGGCDFGCLETLDAMLGSDVSGSADVAAVIVEPMQGRGGDLVPPTGWLSMLREVTARHGVLLIADEIYTGFGRTGRWFACEHENVVPDLMAVGKGLGGGVPISACVGRAEVMERWGQTRGEGLHTSTFLGNPLTCAMALASLDVMESEDLVARSATLGAKLSGWLEQAIGGHPRVGALRGRGLMQGVALLDEAGQAWAGGGVVAMGALLRAGFIVSPAGRLGDVLSLSPPLVVTEAQLEAGVAAISSWVRSLPE